jgi:lysophospholipase L1-like esterase
MMRSRRAAAAALAATLALGMSVFAAGMASGTPSLEPAPDTAPHDGTRVLIIGDSITGNPGCWRAHVWTALTDAGRTINMVGTRNLDECGGVTNAAGETWDPDNAGISGITTAGMYVRIGRDGLLQRTEPDVVVAMLGTNDLLGGLDAERILAQYALLVDLIHREAPGAPIVIAAPPPIAEDRCPGCQAHVDAISAELPTWAETVSTDDAPVFVAVHVAGFDPAEDMHDGIHPNADGEVKIAAALLPAVEAALDAQEEEYVPWASLIIGLAAVLAGLVVIWWWRTHGAAKELDDIMPPPPPEPEPAPPAKRKPRTPAKPKTAAKPKPPARPTPAAKAKPKP